MPFDGTEHVFIGVKKTSFDGRKHCSLTSKDVLWIKPQKIELVSKANGCIVLTLLRSETEQVQVL